MKDETWQTRSEGYSSSFRFLTSVFACMSVFQQLGKTRYDAHAFRYTLHHRGSDRSRPVFRPVRCDSRVVIPGKTRKNDAFHLSRCRMSALLRIFPTALFGKC